jgi:protein TonB
MTEGGFYQQKRMNPQAIAIVILLHGAAFTALLMAKGDFVARILPTRTSVEFIDAPKPPPEKPLPPQPHTATAPTRLDTPKPQIPIRTTGPMVSEPPIAWTRPVPSGPIELAKVEPPVPPSPPHRTFEPARARANLGSYVSDADYPDSASRDGEQGTTRFRLSVGADGRVTDCTVTGSSGSSALDAATCRLMKSRARFTPARDSNGNPATDNVASAIRWVLPAG